MLGFRSVVFIALFAAPMTAFGYSLPFAALPAVVRVTVPEYWSTPDSLGLFVVASGIFGLLVRSKVLRVCSRGE